MGVDKFDQTDRYQAIIMVLCAPLILCFFTSSGANSAEKWSFELHPQPLFREMTRTEQDLVFLNVETDTYEEICVRRIRASYQIYNARYVDFSQTGEEAENFLDWKIHVVTQPEGVEAICIAGGALRSINYLSPSPGFYYCGLYSDLPESDDDMALVTGVDEMIAYANTGSLFAIERLLIANDDMPEMVSLNSDVAYYFSRLAENQENLEDESLSSLPKLMNLNPDLSDERKLFVEQAAVKLDLQSVLQTTQACPPKS